MRGSMVSDEGLGIVEVVIGMLLLAVIAVAILPALWQGIQYSSQQSATATATRELNSLIEGIRENPDCGQIGTATSAHTFTDGSGATITSAGSYSACPAPSRTVTIALTATDAGGYVLATLKAIVYVP